MKFGLNLNEFKRVLCTLDREDTVVLTDPDFTEAVIGISSRGQVIYDYDTMVEILMDRDGMSNVDAIQFIDYNTMRAIYYMGEKAPIILHIPAEYLEYYALSLQNKEEE